jgi:hypothetical protein
MTTHTGEVLSEVPENDIPKLSSLGFGRGFDIRSQSKLSFLTNLATERSWTEKVPECHRGRIRILKRRIVMQVIIELCLHKYINKPTDKHNYMYFYILLSGVQLHALA